MEVEDELGSFFAEINEIEAVTENKSEDVKQGLLPQLQPQIGASEKTETISAAPVPSQVIFAKPAEIKNHVVYTYDQSVYSLLKEDDSYEYDGSGGLAIEHFSSYSMNHVPSQTSSSSSSSLAAYTTASQPSAPVKLRTDKTFVRKAADEVWVDETLKEWPENDYRIFVGDLAKDVSTEMLTKHFQPYKSFAKAKARLFLNGMQPSLALTP
jgi:hypothetical protein